MKNGKKKLKKINYKYLSVELQNETYKQNRHSVIKTNLKKCIESMFFMFCLKS